MSEDDSRSSVSSVESEQQQKQKEKRSNKNKKRKLEKNDSSNSPNKNVESENQSSVESLPKNDDAESYCDIGQNRRVTIRQWKKILQIDIREFYEDSKSGELKPGKKGIALSKEQWN